MLLRGRPVTIPTPDPSTGDESDVSAGLIQMNSIRDVGRTTGWYWIRLSPGADPRDPDLWRAAVQEGRGPLHTPNDAFLAAQTATVESADLGGRLDEAARQMRLGYLEPDITKVAEYLENAAAIDIERRGV